MDKIHLYSISPDELIQRVSDKILEALNNNHQPAAPASDEITIDTAVKVYQVNKSTFYNWRNKGIIVIKKLGGRSYVSRSEITKAMVNSKPKSYIAVK